MHVVSVLVKKIFKNSHTGFNIHWLALGGIFATFGVIYFRSTAFLCEALANVKKRTEVPSIPRVFRLLEDRIPSSATNIIT
jgi:hypothetical protein